MTLDQIERSLERLRSRLYRTINAINKLEKTQRRLQRKAALIVATPEQEPVAIVSVPVKSETAVTIAKSITDDLGIPDYLKRPNPKDEAAKAEILAQQEAEKKKKTAARINKLKADKAGDRAKMPLTGKAALAAINAT